METRLLDIMILKEGVLRVVTLTLCTSQVECVENLKTDTRWQINFKVSIMVKIFYFGAQS